MKFLQARGLNVSDFANVFRVSQKRRWILQSVGLVKAPPLLHIACGQFLSEINGGEGSWRRGDVMSCRVGACENVGKLSLLICLFICLSVGGVSCLAKHAFLVDSLVAVLTPAGFTDAWVFQFDQTCLPRVPIHQVLCALTAANLNVPDKIQKKGLKMVWMEEVSRREFFKLPGPL